MTQQSSAMSITQLCHMDEPEDSNVKLETVENDTVPNNQEHFIRRLPLVHTALKAYENSSSVVKYGAEMIESYAGPIYDKLGYDRKLKEEASEDDETTAATTALARASLYDTHHHQPLMHQRSTATGRRSVMEEDRKSRSAASRSTSPHRPYTLQRPSSSSKSRWQQIVLHAGSAAGTTAAVISEESMKCLRYCLSWLQYAMQHIDQQMNLLRNFLVSLATGSSNATTTTKKDVAIVEQNSNTLAKIKKEIVDTLRKVVEVVSKYAGSGLPEQAKASVRAFILQLPSRWAILNNTRQTSPSNSPRVGPVADEQQQPLHETSIKLLDFGGESIEMLNSVSIVFSDTIERAELWIKRLKVVGVNSTAAATSTMDTN
ncbi:transcriptional regulator opi1 [Mucor circinelloides]